MLDVGLGTNCHHLAAGRVGRYHVYLHSPSCPGDQILGSFGDELDVNGLCGTGRSCEPGGDEPVCRMVTVAPAVGQLFGTSQAPGSSPGGFG